MWQIHHLSPCWNLSQALGDRGGNFEQANRGVVVVVITVVTANAHTCVFNSKVAAYRVLIDVCHPWEVPSK